MKKFENNARLIPAGILVPEKLPVEIISDILLSDEHKLIVEEKRFCSTDLWKIHVGKRNANVYPRRV
ncbi:MAG TPA: hypothetical protein VFV31_07925 [Chitinophagaceae bacterium]|nr:hypothetical protein [Chitinophagaceae bacterium]